MAWARSAIVPGRAGAFGVVVAGGVVTGARGATGAGGATSSSAVGEPGPASATAPGTALLTSASRTCCGVRFGFAASSSAAAPVTCGVAIEVPLITAVAESLVL